MNKETIYSEEYASCNIRELRRFLKLSQAEFADRLGFTRSKIKRCESEDSAATLDVLLTIKEHFNVPLSQLLSKPDECSN